MSEGSESTQKNINISGFTLVTVLVCAALCMFFMRTLFLSMFYLAPLGCAVILTGSYWIVFFAAVSANIIICLLTNAFSLIDVIYMTAMFFIFTWMMGSGVSRGLYRFIVIAIAGTIGFFAIVNPNDSFYILFEQLIEGMSLGIPASDLMEMVNGVLLRGGALVSMSLLFFVNRQLSIAASWLLKKKSYGRKFTEFFAPPGLIWILSGAAATIILSIIFNIQILEIIAWNILIICAIIYLVQGAGVLMHVLTKKSSVFRISVCVLAVFLVLSPFSVMIILAMLILGIAEIWIPIRLSNKT